MREFRQFVDEHWPDILACHLIYIGVAIVLFAHGDNDVSHVGEGLIMMGAGGLSFRRMGHTP